MNRKVFDIETNGLLPQLTKLHSLTIQDPDTGQEWSCADQPGYMPIKEGLAILAEADELIGHNIINFDIPAIQKVYPWWSPKEGCKFFDTIVATRTMWPDLYGLDAGLVKKGVLDPGLMKRHSLKSWGQRLGVMKDDFESPDEWQTWSVEMQDYAEQDTRVTTSLLKFIEERDPPRAAIELEQDIVRVLDKQEAAGFPFDMDAARELQGDLAQQRIEVENELIETFGSWWVATPMVAKRTCKNKLKQFDDIRVPRFSDKTGKRLKDYIGPPLETMTKGEKWTKITRVTFNPGSRKHIAKVLKERFGWEPEQYTKGGDPVVDEDMLSGLAHIPEAALLIKYLALTKREGALANGNGSWINLAQQDKAGTWRIHGRVNHMGAPTSRMSHSKPNVTAVPKVGKFLGAECRALYTAEPGKVLVGADATSAQLRWLAHYLGRWDNGAYRDVLLNGDPHIYTAEIFGFEATAAGSPKARGKTMNYAYLFGAFDKKLGSIIDPSASAKEQRRLGAEARVLMETRIEGLGTLVEGLNEKLRQTARFKGGKLVPSSQYINGLDGRRIPIKSDYTVLNYLLQSAEAIAMKWADVRFHQIMTERGYVHGVDFTQHSFNHDELQVSAHPDIAEEVGETLVLAIQQSGEHFQSRCPIDGEYSIGANWRDTH